MAESLFLIAGIACAGILLCIFMGVRNEVVFRARMKAIDYIFDQTNDDELLEIYEATDYGSQMWQFTKWKMEDFFPEFKQDDIHIQPTKPWPKK
jgi:hypothetical protein